MKTNVSIKTIFYLSKFAINTSKIEDLNLRLLKTAVQASYFG